MQMFSKDKALAFVSFSNITNRFIVLILVKLILCNPFRDSALLHVGNGIILSAAECNTHSSVVDAEAGYKTKICVSPCISSSQPRSIHTAGVYCALARLM